MTGLVHAMRERVAPEDGFTLPEMIMAIAILGIIIGPITASMILGLLETTSTRDRLADSTSAQVLSAYLSSDIQSSEDVGTSSACLTVELAGATPVLGLSWTDPLDDALTSIAYVELERSGSTQKQLHRVTCPDGATSFSTLVIQNLAATSGFVPTFTCDGGACAGGELPDLVSVAVRVESIEPVEASSYDELTFTIEAQRRVGS